MRSANGVGEYSRMRVMMTAKSREDIQSENAKKEVARDIAIREFEITDFQDQTHAVTPKRNPDSRIEPCSGSTAIHHSKS